MAYCVNIVRSLLNLLNLSTLPYFVFLEIQVLNFWYLFRNLRILLVFPFLIFSLHFRIFLILRFLMAEFHGIYYVPPGFSLYFAFWCSIFDIFLRHLFYTVLKILYTCHIPFQLPVFFSESSWGFLILASDCLCRFANNPLF